MLHNDIIRLIITYLDPLSLEPFFNLHKVDFRLSFKYDAYYFPRLTVQEFERIFRQFPNIKITGVAINISKLKKITRYHHILKFDLNGSFINIHKLRNHRITHLSLRSKKALTLNLEPFDNCMRHIDIMFCNLENIKGISFCTALKSFRASNYANISELTCCPELRTLELRGCNNLDVLYKLNLRTLILNKCTILNLPTNCINLRTLDLTTCVILKLPTNCINLQKLILYDCHNLTNVNELSGCINLRTITISSCHNIENIDGLNGCDTLRILTLQCCNKLGSISKLSQNKKLQKIDIWWCKNLTGVEDIIKFCSPQKIEISSCKKAIKINELINCSSLCEFEVVDCGKNKWEFTTNCTKLEIIRIDNYTEDFRNLTNCTTLKKLEIVDSNNLISLFGLPYHHLKELKLDWCRNLINLNPLKECTSLTHLRLTECHILKDLSPLSNLTKLTHIDVQFCTNIQNIDDLYNIPELYELNLAGCHKLKSLNVLTQHSHISFLKLDECTSLEALPNLSKSQLRLIQFRYCDNLKDITTLFHCTKLKNIYTSEALMDTLKINAKSLPKDCEISL